MSNIVFFDMDGTIVDDDDRVLAKWFGPKVKAVHENKMIK